MNALRLERCLLASAGGHVVFGLAMSIPPAPPISLDARADSAVNQWVLVTAEVPVPRFAPAESPPVEARRSIEPLELPPTEVPRGEARRPVPPPPGHRLAERAGEAPPAPSVETRSSNVARAGFDRAASEARSRAFSRTPQTPSQTPDLSARAAALALTDGDPTFTVAQDLLPSPSGPLGPMALQSRGDGTYTYSGQGVEVLVGQDGRVYVGREGARLSSHPCCNGRDDNGDPLIDQCPCPLDDAPTQVRRRVHERLAPFLRRAYGL